MKIKRQKKVARILNFFKHNFGHRAPYQLLLDGTFCQACLTEKVHFVISDREPKNKKLFLFLQVNIKEQLPKYLDSETKILTTQCCIKEMEKLGPPLYGALKILKQFPVHKCGHDKDPKPAIKCLRSMLGDNNPNR